MSTRYEADNSLGVPADRWTVQAFRAGMERVPDDIRSRVRVTQGAPSFASASGNTHGGRGAIDIIIDRGTPHEYRIVENALRYVGFDAYARTRLVRNGRLIWPDHLHMILRGHPGLSPAAAAQHIAYLNRRDALASNGPDPNPYRPTNIFTYREADMALSTKDKKDIARYVWEFEMRGTADIPDESAAERLRQVRQTSADTVKLIRPGEAGKHRDGQTYSLLKQILSAVSR